jgi:anti-sigma factor (TIGR02949 family)
MNDLIQPSEGNDYCELVVHRMHEFLDNELDEATGDDIRAHLAACEPCLHRYDVEQAVRTLLRTCCTSEVAPASLRTRIVTQLTVIRRTL